MTQESIAISTTPPLPGLQMVQQANAALATIATDFAGDTDPASVAGPYMTWADTSNGLLKRRNAAGTDWVVESALFRPALSAFPIAELPTSDVGDVYVPERASIYSFRYGAYAPNSLPSKYRAGGRLTHSTNSVTIAPGRWRGVADDVDLSLLASLSKTLQTSGAWAAGSGGNGLFTGSATTGTSYHMFVIRNDSTGAVDAGFDTSVTAANRPSGWTAYRRVGTVRYTTSNNILAFTNIGHDFIYSDGAIVLAGANLTTSFTTISLAATCPPGVRSWAKLGVSMTGSVSGSIIIRTPGIPWPALVRNSVITGISGNIMSVMADVYTDTSAAVEAAATVSMSGNFSLVVNGYRDFIED